MTCNSFIIHAYYYVWVIFSFHIMCLLEFTCNVMFSVKKERKKRIYRIQYHYHHCALSLFFNRNRWLYHKKISADWENKWKPICPCKTFNSMEHLRDSQDPNNKNRHDLLTGTFSDSLQECVKTSQKLSLVLYDSGVVLFRVHFHLFILIISNISIFLPVNSPEITIS